MTACEDTLIERAAHGDQEAFLHLWEAHRVLDAPPSFRWSTRCLGALGRGRLALAGTGAFPRLPRRSLDGALVGPWTCMQRFARSGRAQPGTPAQAMWRTVPRRTH